MLVMYFMPAFHRYLLVLAQCYLQPEVDVNKMSSAPSLRITDLGRLGMN